MAKLIRIRRNHPRPPVTDSVREEPEWVLLDGVTVTTGDVVLVRHISFGGRWVELPIKRITSFKGAASFHFYYSPPGTITVSEGNVKSVPVKKTRKKKDS